MCYFDGMPNKPPMKNRVVRVPDDLWEAARTQAAERGENISDVIRAALTRYINKK